MEIQLETMAGLGARAMPQGIIHLDHDMLQTALGHCVVGSKHQLEYFFLVVPDRYLLRLMTPRWSCYAVVVPPLPRQGKKRKKRKKREKRSTER